MAGENITTAYARLNFVAIDKKVAYEGGKEKFTVTLMFPNKDVMKDDRGDGKPYSPFTDAKAHDLTAIREKVTTEAKARFKGAYRSPIRDGEEGKWSEGYTFIRATTDYKPQLFNRDRTEVSEAEAGALFYNGAWVRAVLSPYTYDQKGNKGVSLGLRGLQFVCHDEPIRSGRIDAEQSFDALPDEIAGAADDLDALIKG